MAYPLPPLCVSPEPSHPNRVPEGGGDVRADRK